MAAPTPDHERNAGTPVIVWRLALRSSPQEVFDLLATSEGRARFWARRAPESEGRIHFTFPNGQELGCEILQSVPGRRLAIRYFGGSRVEFVLEPDAGGCLLTLRETELSESDARLNSPGWVSVLLNLKACADFGIDLRNHHPERTWDQGFIDN